MIHHRTPVQGVDGDEDVSSSEVGAGAGLGGFEKLENQNDGCKGADLSVVDRVWADWEIATFEIPHTEGERTIPQLAGHSHHGCLFAYRTPSFLFSSSVHFEILLFSPHQFYTNGLQLDKDLLGWTSHGWINIQPDIEGNHSPSTGQDYVQLAILHIIRFGHPVSYYFRMHRTNRLDKNTRPHTDKPQTNAVLPPSSPQSILYQA
ncbi:hypothetical protein BDK51DRAFT_30809 [Blyttiomyces helicus]|uniref:Uncharacterized protein n=1 Tax=Blyttiomyces helicus TaxID=388810 RepID=A0A4P9WCL8_9FUNG|nr:hypothetical protein BDK51DRAFT_30809 [Blyttiomyces helicus]|eukprot:RKO89353.1 hypothetical protein BDK51DRAFT_30809 [Blyttiomyces helicus]